MALSEHRKLVYTDIYIFFLAAVFCIVYDVVLIFLLCYNYTPEADKNDSANQ